MEGLIAHLMRAPIIGGSELETLAITRTFRRFRQRVVFPRRCAGLGQSIRERFPPEVDVDAVADVEEELRRAPPDLLHIQFPFIIEPSPRGLDSVLELRRLPALPAVFTVHAAVNVPVLEDLHYVFHTEGLYRRFAARIPPERATICGSLVELPAAPRAERPARGRAVILWVSRNEDAKFHPATGDICRAVLAACKDAAFRFIGQPEEVLLPLDERVSVIPAPASDLEAEYRGADLFWAFPHPLLEETWCRTVTEAMGHGLPAVVAAHGAMREQLEHGVHGLVAATPEACAAALIELCRDGARRLRMGAAAARRARALHEETVARLEEMYGRLLRRKERHAARPGG
ncbi:MAG: glycosyltransferase [Planctomycetes bacterium]|nr:glycosyltransferase [Planctomycetota bacterium]